MTLVLKVICRACHQECGDYKHLMDETLIDDESTTLGALLNYCTTVDPFATNDNDANTFPVHICNSCVEHLLQAYLFKEMVLQTDRELRDNRQLVNEEEEKKPIGLSTLVRALVEDEECSQSVEAAQNTETYTDGSISTEPVTPRNVLTNNQGAVDDVEYEMEEWLDVDEILEEVKREEDYDDLGDMVIVAGETVEHSDNDFLPSDKENEEENINDCAVIEKEATNTEDDLEYIVYEDTEEVETKEKQEHRVQKRRSLKDGNLTKEDLACKYCGKQFDKMCRLREHTYMHTGEKPHMCSICGKRSRTKTHHNVHMLTHSEHKRYKCSICGQHYRTSNSLRVHERKHSNIRPYACPICEKSFHTAEQRKLHVMLHTGERPYSCDKCGKAYRESHSLRQHMQSHDDLKPYQCEVCGKGLTQMSGYKRHMLLHTGEYPHKCDICGRAFRISSNLLAHKRLHLDIMPFQCAICSKGFTTSTRLRRHMIQHEHNTEPKEPNFKPRKPRVEPVYVEQKMAKSRVVEIL